MVTAILGVLLAVAPDTAQLAAHLKSERGQLVIPAAHYVQIRREYASWIDSRVARNSTVEQMTAELTEAGAMAGDSGEIEKSTGYLQAVSRMPVQGAEQEIFAIVAPVGASGNCRFDETVVLYGNITRLRVGLIMADSSLEGQYRLTSISASQDKGSWTVATGWDHTNCTSNWNPKLAAIDVVAPDGHARQVLRRTLDAFSGGPAEGVSTRIEGGAVVFRYDAGCHLGEADVVPGVAKYRLVNGLAVQEPPLALSVLGFVGEWLELNDNQAAAYSSPQAARAHHQAGRES